MSTSPTLQRAVARTIARTLEQLESRTLLAASFDYVSDLTPTVANNGYGPVERDLSNGESLAGDGRQIKINGVRYNKGLGMHAHGEVHYDLLGRYRSFVSDIGVDDESGRAGSVVFQVYADGEKMFDSGVMTGVDGFKRVNIDVTGKQEMVLLLNDGGDGTAYDHGDWAAAHLNKPLGFGPVITKMSDVEVRESRPQIFLSGVFADTSAGPYFATVDYGDGSGRNRLTLNDDKTFDLEHVYDASFDGDYTVTMRVSNGLATGVSTFRVAVRNDAPYNVGLVGGDESGSISALAGITAYTNGVFSDPGEFGGEKYSATVNYGDGTDPVTANVDGRFFSSRHVYRRSGTYTVTSTITDAGGKSGVGTSTIVVHDPVFQYVSDLQPTNDAPYRANRAADGSNMKINGQKYQLGVGVFADSDLRYALDGQYQSLISDVGVDDKVGVNGSLVFQVFGDGVLLFESGPMTGRMGSKRVNVDVRGVQELQLVVTHAGNGAATSMDRGDWAGIRLA
jgi:hypothetical protein